MTNPWEGPRHRSWASDTYVTAALFVIVLLATVITDYLNGALPPPTYLTGLLGASATAFFAAASSDKSKREREIADDARVARLRATDINETATRAEAKADQIAETVKRDRPDLAAQLPEAHIDAELDDSGGEQP